jgi:hypothetical protein
MNPAVAPTTLSVSLREAASLDRSDLRILDDLPG